MIIIKNQQQINQIAEASVVLATVLDEVCARVAPGVTTAQLNQYAHQRIHDLGAQPSFYGYKGYPAAICASVDNAVIHGIPNDRPLREGQIVGIDCGVRKNGYYSDSARTIPVGSVDPTMHALLRHTEEALRMGIAAARVDARLSDISAAIEHVGTRHGYGIVYDFCGHGVGVDIHEEPNILNVTVGAGRNRLQQGMVFAIEPMFCLHSPDIYVADDKWTVLTADGHPAAHFEHTIVVTADGPRILSTL